MKLLIFLIIILLILIISINFLLKELTTFKVILNEEDNSDICIILTCTVNINKNIRVLAQKNSNERKKIYIKSIKKWLDNTNFNIIVVDNSDYTFPELSEYLLKYKNRFEIINYNEKSLSEPAKSILENDPSKGIHEIYAINYAYNNSELINYSTFIIKVTGRYYVDIKNIITYPYPDFIRQNDNKRCEIVGCKTELFNYLFNVILEYTQNEFDRDFIEIIYKRRIDKLGKNIQNLPLLKIDGTKTGSGNNMIYSL
jgi:hypothetical protein